MAQATHEEPPIVYVVDDDGSVRKGLSRLFRSVALEVETFASPTGFLEKQLDNRPSCLVVDVRMPGMSGLEFQQQLLKRGIRIPIIIITAHADVTTSVRALKSGAVDFLQKPFNEQHLLDLVQRTIARDRKRREKLLHRREIRERMAEMTPREREVFNGVVAGLQNKQIAYELGASEATIKQHRASVMEKMKASSLADLVRMAIEAGRSEESDSAFD